MADEDLAHAIPIQYEIATAPRYAAVRSRDPGGDRCRRYLLGTLRKALVRERCRCRRFVLPADEGRIPAPDDGAESPSEAENAASLARLMARLTSNERDELARRLRGEGPGSSRRGTAQSGHAPCDAAIKLHPATAPGDTIVNRAPTPICCAGPCSTGGFVLGGVGTHIHSCRG